MRRKHPELLRNSVRIVSLVAVLALVLPPDVATALPITTQQGLVVAAHPLASKAGARILAQGGNAADALVATAFTLAVVEPHSSGLGGGGFAMYFDARTRAVTLLDFRETAPGAFTPALFETNGTYDSALARFGARSVAVPGAVAGYAALAERFGTKKLAALVAPAQTLAKQGFPVAAAHQRALGFTGYVKLSPEAVKQFVVPLGTRLKNPALAKLLGEIGKKGPKAFYEGKAARALVDAVKSGGGALSLDDLAWYRVRELKPLEGRFRGHRIVTTPPPSAGGLLILQTLGVLDRLPKRTDWRDVNGLHTMVEAFRRSFLTRSLFIGDPRREPDVTRHVERLLAPATLDTWATSITERPLDSAALSKLVAAPRDGDDTTSLAVVDAQGNVAVMTTTINGPFGSGLFVPALGVLLNNEMDDFAPPSGANLYGLGGQRYNAPAPGKTPVSSMAPTIVFDGDRPVLALGASGGSRIGTTLAQVIVRVLDHGMDVQSAVEWPRIHAQLTPDVVMAEPWGLDAETKRALEARGHVVSIGDSIWAGCQALTIDADGTRRGTSDPRNEGVAAASDQLDAR